LTQIVNAITHSDKSTVKRPATDLQILKIIPTAISEFAQPTVFSRACNQLGVTAIM
jgi:hypothetical protein